jgi:probable rRNA maturation factor
MKSEIRTRAARRRRQRPAAAPAIDIVVDSPLWKAQRGVKPLLHRAISQAAAMAASAGGEVAVLLVDDTAMRALNRDWRGKDEPTNVLSFPARSDLPAAPPAGQRGSRPRLLGDIVIAYETTAREALAAHLPFGHHLVHLAVHGFLHLVGHDHEAEAEAEAMEALEVAVLARLDVPDPYAMRDAEA